MSTSTSTSTAATTPQQPAPPPLTTNDVCIDCDPPQPAPTPLMHDPVFWLILVGAVVFLGLLTILLRVARRHSSIINAAILDAHANKIARENFHIDVIKTTKGAVIVHWYPDDLTLWGDAAQAVTIKTKLTELLDANPDADLANYAGALGITIDEVERPWLDAPKPKLDTRPWYEKRVDAIKAHATSLHAKLAELDELKSEHPELASYIEQQRADILDDFATRAER